jgi:uncharacterized protein (TIRG00374 family)
MIRLLKWLIVTGVVVWLLWGIDVKLFWDALRKLDPLGVTLTFLAVLFSDLVISYRWYYLSGYRHTFLSSFEANMLAFFLNIFAPAKLGDLSKIYYMHKKDGHDPKHSASLFLIERLFDVLVLGSLILISALFILPSKTSLAVALTLFLLLALFFYALYDYSFAIKLIHLIPFSKPKIYAYKIFKQIRQNLTKKRIFITFVLTLAVWGGYYLNNYVFFLTATPFELTLSQIFVASTLAFAVSAIPLTPGGIGTFQAAFILTLGWYGISKEEALAASTALQILYILPATLYSLYLLITKEFLWRRHVSAK